jgi:hypothetical protein
MAATKYYLDGNTLADALSVFTDAALTTKATDGYYSSGTISRRQVSGYLQPAVPCPDCGDPCDVEYSATGGLNVVYRNEIMMGNTTGAIVIKFDVGLVADGFRAIYEGVTYTALSAKYDGYHNTSNSGNFVLVGDDSYAHPTVPSHSPVSYDIYTWNGSAWVDSGSNLSYSFQTGDESYSSSVTVPSLAYYCIVPKPTSTDSQLTIEVINSASSNWSMELGCPQALDMMVTTGIQSTSNLACLSSVYYENFYVAYVNGKAPLDLGLYDWVFTDANGVTAVSNGWFGQQGDQNAYRVANGVIVEIIDCEAP